MNTPDDSIKLAETLEQYRDLVARQAREAVGREQWSALCDEAGGVFSEYWERISQLLESVNVRLGHDTYLWSAFDELELASLDLMHCTEEVFATGHAWLVLSDRWSDRWDAHQDRIEAIADPKRRHDELMRGDPEVDRLADLTGVLAPTFYRRLADWIGIACGVADRAGQLLNFVYFNTREFDRETFPTVIEKIKTNYVRDELLLREQGAWKRLQEYTADQKHGFAALVQRRNAIVHSVSLRPSVVGAMPDRSPVKNAIERKRMTRAYLGAGEKGLNDPREDVAGGVKEELEFVVRHARSVAERGVDVVAMCRFGFETLGLWPGRFGRGGGLLPGDRAV